MGGKRRFSLNDDELELLDVGDLAQDILDLLLGREGRPDLHRVVRLHEVEVRGGAIRTIVFILFQRCHVHLLLGPFRLVEDYRCLEVTRVRVDILEVRRLFLQVHEEVLSLTSCLNE